MCKESNNIVRCGTHTMVKSISHVNEAVVNFDVSFFDVNMDISMVNLSRESPVTSTTSVSCSKRVIYHSKKVRCNCTYWQSCKSS